MITLLSASASLILIFIKKITLYTYLFTIALYGCKQNSDIPTQTEWIGNQFNETEGLIYKNENLYTGILQDSFDNGQIKYSKSVINGKINGNVAGHHYDGQLSYKYKSIKGKKEGVYVEYYPSGNLQIRSVYQSDTIIEHKVVDINGKVLVNFKIKDGRPYGLLGSSECRSVFDNDSFTRKE